MVYRLIGDISIVDGIINQLITGGHHLVADGHGRWKDYKHHVWQLQLSVYLQVVMMFGIGKGRKNSMGLCKHRVQNTMGYRQFPYLDWHKTELNHTFLGKAIVVHRFYIPLCPHHIPLNPLYVWIRTVDVWWLYLRFLVVSPTSLMAITSIIGQFTRGKFLISGWTRYMVLLPRYIPSHA
jgi:hypothetical protein